MTATQATEPVPAGPAPRRLGPLAALAGLLSAAVALGVAEMLAALVGPTSSPVVAVGDAAITLTPEPVKGFAIRTFGESDKIALVVGTLVLIALVACAVGVVARHRLLLGRTGIALFGLVGVVAAVTRPAGGVLDALPSLAGALAGVVALGALIHRLPSPVPAPVSPPAAAAPASDGEVLDRLRSVLGSTNRAGGALDRRGFFVAAGVAAGVATVAGGGGLLLQRRFDVAEARAGLALPRPADSAPALPDGADLSADIDGLTPLFTRNRDFYRVDTALLVPQVHPAGYRLRVSGMVDSPRTWSLTDLLDRDDVIDRDVTLTCVSNEVGGTLAGTARWTGIPLGAFLREHGVRDGSSQLLCRSSDGMTIGAPTRAALDVEDAMLAFGMNGEPLPVEHGFPVRMVIPGLYGYVSACKWLVGIEATTFEAVDAYWVARGWAAEGPIKVASRIDVPASGRGFPAGRRPIAGVAWAQTRGIGRVEVRVDDGDWTEARLAPAVDADVWRQWVLPFDFTPGRHDLTVRATSADGEVQPEKRTAPYPSGATGWHSVQVEAT
jgi:DMSO/TMAO reductase YedYZ molybdopterin-dependent catalytic subunit